MSKGSLFQINLLGTSFSIQTDQEEDYLKELVTFFANRIREVEKSTATQDPIRTSILAGILITDDLFRERRRIESSEEVSLDEIEKITHQIIERLDKSLKEI